jgi:ketosteroid isomerase-like protein
MVRVEADPGSTENNVMTSPTASAAPHAFGFQSKKRNPEREAANLETARRYLAAIEASTTDDGASAPGADQFFAPDVVQEEFPNRLLPNGARRDLAGLREGAERGRAVLRSQRYEVKAAYADGDVVILEVLWVGTLKIPIGSLAAGQEMRAHFAVFLEFRDELIYRQRNYDCFEPY